MSDESLEDIDIDINLNNNNSNNAQPLCNTPSNSNAYGRKRSLSQALSLSGTLPPSKRSRTISKTNVQKKKSESKSKSKSKSKRAPKSVTKSITKLQMKNNPSIKPAPQSLLDKRIKQYPNQSFEKRDDKMWCRCCNKFVNFTESSTTKKHVEKCQDHKDKLIEWQKDRNARKNGSNKEQVGIIDSFRNATSKADVARASIVAATIANIGGSRIALYNKLLAGAKIVTRDLVTNDSSLVGLFAFLFLSLR